MKIGRKIFDVLNHTYVMGILNLTPDSFSDGGSYNNRELALQRAAQMVEEGVDIIDLGGESIKPGYQKITAQEEIERILPIMEAIKKEFDVPVSVDTYKSEVAKAAIHAGVDLINDIWGLKYDKRMAKLIAESKVACCLMHNRNNSTYEDFIRDVFEDLGESIQIAQKAGIEEDKIILDPGVGFAKTYEMNLDIIRYLEDFHRFGYPLLLGTSRKSVLGITLDLPVEERLEGTLVTTVMAVMKHYAFVRVHDIKENKRTIRMTEKILHGMMDF